MIADTAISKRARSIDTSGIRRVFDLAATLKNPINLSIGQPDFDALPELKEAAKRAIDSGKSGYTVTQGIPELRAAVRARYGLAEDDHTQVFVTSGVSAGILLSFLAVLDPGDEVLIPDPFFCVYRDIAMVLNSVPTYYDLYPDFAVTAERIEAGITPKTKAILVNSPGNPTGVAMSQAALDEVIELAKAKDLWLIYDEIYEYFCFDQAHASALGKYEKTIILNGFSKSHGIPGWRLAYVMGPKEIVSQMLKVQQYSFVCAPSVLQHAAAELVQPDFTEKLQEYREKRDFMYEALKEKFDCVQPGGAFYLFPHAPGMSGQSFVEKCIDSNLLCVPGHVFSRVDTHFRLSFSVPMEQLQKGAEVLCRLV